MHLLYELSMYKIKQIGLIKLLSYVFFTSLLFACSQTSSSEIFALKDKIQAHNQSSKQVLNNISSYAKRQDGAIRVTDCKGMASCQNPVFSENGGEIMFTRFLNGYNDGPSEIVHLNLSTLTESIVVPTHHEYDHVNIPGSSWKNGMLAYASDESLTEHEEIFIYDQKIKKHQQITKHKGNSNFVEPSFSNDGRVIVFEKSVRPSQYTREQCENYDLNKGSLWTVDLKTYKLTDISFGDEGDSRLPNTSPVENKILFQRRKHPTHAREEPDWDIWTMTLQGKDKKNITQSRWHETDASWSGDGEYIVYSSDYGGIDCPNLFVISSNGGKPKRVTFSSDNEDGAPSFSIDSAMVAFESHKTDDEDSPSNIWIIKSTL